MDALQAFACAVQLKPEHIEARVNLGLLYESCLQLEVQQRYIPLPILCFNSLFHSPNTPNQPPPHSPTLPHHHADNILATMSTRQMACNALRVLSPARELFKIFLGEKQLLNLQEISKIEQILRFWRFSAKFCTK